MRSLVLLAIVLAFCLVSVNDAVKRGKQNVQDNDFAEFEEEDDTDKSASKPADVPKQEAKKPVQPKVIMSPHAAENEEERQDDEDATVEDDDEYKHLQDEDEFINFGDKPMGKPASKADKKKDIVFNDPKIPRPGIENWDNFLMEILMLAGLVVYFLNFLNGKNKNHKLAQAWFTTHREILESNFSVVGDDGTGTEVTKGVLMKESENIYSLWCSGRTCCEGMLVTLKLLKRQDLVSTISKMFKKACDQVVIKVVLDKAEMSNFVLCFGQKKALAKYHKEMNDLSLYCKERKSGDKFKLPSHFQVLSEIGEATEAVIDRPMEQAVTRYQDMIECIHISDQFSGPKQQDQDQQNSKLPETEKVLIFSFNVPGEGKGNVKAVEEMKDLLKMVLHLVDRVKKLKLSHQAKEKAQKNRQNMQAELLKATHAQRQEDAQTRREARKRDTKDRIMNEEDPEKQRKLEERERRREEKKKQPKVKMMKIKAM